MGVTAPEVVVLLAVVDFVAAKSTLEPVVVDVKDPDNGF